MIVYQENSAVLFVMVVHVTVSRSVSNDSNSGKWQTGITDHGSCSCIHVEGDVL